MIALLQHIGNTIRGLHVTGALKMVKTIVVPQLLYGSEAWWRGLLKPGQRGWGYKHLLHSIDIVLNAALRKALPVYKTIPISALRAEGGIFGALHLLEEARKRDHLRLGELRNHPLGEILRNKPGRKSRITKSYEISNRALRETLREHWPARS